MSIAKKRGLGKGLSALLNDDRPAGAAGSDDRAIVGDPSRRLLPVSFLERNPDQPRTRFDTVAIEELTASVKEKGVLQPILVREIGEDRYQIVAGERRWRAAQKAGIHDVPVVVRDLSDTEVLELGLIENIQREDLTPIEEAKAFKRLMQEFGHTQEVLSDIVGKSRSHVANLLRLLTLPVTVQILVDDGKLTMGHARALIGVKNAEIIAQEIIAKGLSVRQTEALAAEDKGNKPRTIAAARARRSANKDADTIALEKDLSAAIGMKVSIDHQGEGGDIVIKYASLEELDDLCGKLGVCGL
ncbi:chromosome partitioning protein ParB [Kordiimonas sediminis]|uniref:Chromosome partitioning protein ParB n=1 Tax=Kordiimonas sediminis TaxID=1735581 RepID=A0A919E5D5_9PROT|nr:ParB/RepB/Spo0J family partition protein [Kordiimonas sediminis]GHF15595.1 chromosome partitioning protein ParB [Kordiimonas sediminis]